MGNYPSFEVRAGEVLDQVEANSRYLTNNGVFDEDTPVPIANVEMFAGNAYHWVVGNLFAQGYGTTPANDSVRAILTNIQALQTTVQVEAAMPTDERGEPNVRYRGFAAQRDQLVNVYIQQHALDQLGQTRATVASKSAFLDLTGKSLDRKDTVYSDDDIPQARFPRGWQKQEVGSKTGSTGGTDDT